MRPQASLRLSSQPPPSQLCPNKSNSTSCPLTRPIAKKTACRASDDREALSRMRATHTAPCDPISNTHRLMAPNTTRPNSISEKLKILATSKMPQNCPHHKTTAIDKTSKMPQNCPHHKTTAIDKTSKMPQNCPHHKTTAIDRAMSQSSRLPHYEKSTKISKRASRYKPKF